MLCFVSLAVKGLHRTSIPAVSLRVLYDFAVLPVAVA